MNKDKLFRLFTYQKENDRDELGMLLSNHIDYVVEGNGCISVDRFEELITDILSWYKNKGDTRD